MKLIMFVAATIALSLLIVWSLDSFGFRSPIFALLVNWLVMSWMAMVGPILDVSLPTAYYSIRRFEQTGRVYERLGIPLFKRLVRCGPLAILSPTLRFPKEKTASTLGQLECEMRKAETAHALIFTVMLLFVGYAVFNGWLDAIVWLLVFNILINGYPVMLQRYNRIVLRSLIGQQRG